MDLYNSYTGKATVLDPERVHSLNELNQLLEQQFAIDPQHQLLLVSPSASRLKEQMIAESQKVYLYDLQLISQPDLARSKLLSMEASTVAQLEEDNMAAPDPAAAFEDLEASHMILSQVVVDRSEWAMRHNEFAKQVADRILNLRPETKTIDSGTHLALNHMSNHLKSLRRTLMKRVKQKEDLDKDIARCSTWSESWARCKRVPGLAPILGTLQRPLVADMFDKALQTQYKIKKQLALVEKAITSLQNRGTTLLATFTQDPLEIGVTGVERLLREMESLTNKVVFDTNNVKALADKDLARTILSGHERSLIPDINAVRKDLLTALNKALDQKVIAQTRLCEVMASISSIQLSSAKLKPEQAKLGKLLQEADSYKAKVAEVIELPFLYGAFIIELNRRQTWQLEHRNMVDLMVERLASLRDVELERMDNWQQYYMSSGIMAEISHDLVHSLPEIEVNLTKISVPDSLTIEDYLEQLDAVGLNSVGDELRGELEAMSEQLAKSLEENGLSMSSSNYENKIRKLESILLQLRFEQERSTSHQARTKSDSTTVKETQLEQKAAGLGERERAIAERERAFAEREQVFAARERALEIKQRAFEEREKQVIEKKAIQDGQEKEIVAKQEETVESLRGENRFLSQAALEISRKLAEASRGVKRMLETMGLQGTITVVNGSPVFEIARVKGLRRASVAGSSQVSEPSTRSGSEPTAGSTASPEAPEDIQWLQSIDKDADYKAFLDGIFIDYDLLRLRVSKRFADMEKLARQFQTEVHSYKSEARKAQHESRNRLALLSFKPGDLVLFLPTRDSLQQPKPWAAFNVGAPHYFLDPKIAAEMQNKEYLIGRVKEITAYTVNASDPDPENNPFGLAEGVTWSKIVADWPNQGKGVKCG
ncbi:Autophagy-related protein 11 [Wickerhamiella sorbophila]|uniref:Autophagy-related protein 11 n=1 Tax=Wickerhamiella sorbophila TaxID=45607 RepID=A0A2T0FN23_9ASCO|nr:Autophagy-related protein 11 [Wickerhamiella sorbophila]PRT56375.1 Autophagy-related protein 11 [Wickerhamiella sorbophila]